MNRFIDANLEIGFYDARPARREVRAQVAFDETGMTMLMRDKGARRAVLYHGERRGQGHYVLNAPKAGVDGTLHRFANGTVLEGSWRARTTRGFWRLRLPADAAIPAQAKIFELDIARAARLTNARRAPQYQNAKGSARSGCRRPAR